MISGPHPPRRPADLATAAMVARLRLGPPRNKITVERRLPVPMRDGTILLADHYAPNPPRRSATVLMRCPYGRGPQFALLARPIAERGYHVVLQSSRGTFGSGGQFRPGVDEAADGQDTVAWLRTMNWFTGKLALAGPSYLAFAAWALAADPPPELTALALYISPHDLVAAGFGKGPFELYNLLWWTDLLASQERVNPLRLAWRVINGDQRVTGMASRMPLAATGASLVRHAPWYGDWLTHPDRDDPYYQGYSAAAALDRVTVPTLLISGFHDFFVEQTVEQYQVLRRRGVPTQLVIGPWTHMALDGGLAVRETVAWLDAYADGDFAAAPPQPFPVRVWTSGADRWLGLPEWPPSATVQRTLLLRAGGGLDGTPAGEGRATLAGEAAPAARGTAPAAPAAGPEMDATAFRYDPADPTPSIGGRIMSIRHGGSQDNAAIEARPDVLTFSTPPLPDAVEVAGVPLVRLYVSSDNPRSDLFARLCDVDPAGKSLNLTDQIIRSAPDRVTAGTVRRVDIPLTDVSHVFLPGHRIRLQLSGGAHPRFARNLGTDADLVYGTTMAPVTHLVQHNELYSSALVLPVLGGTVQVLPPVARQEAEPASAEQAAGERQTAQAG